MLVTMPDKSSNFRNLGGLVDEIDALSPVLADLETVSTQAERIYDPPGLIGLPTEIVASIAARESRDVVKNIRALNEIATMPMPAPIKPA
jgi:hypothetical protein